MSRLEGYVGLLGREGVEWGLLGPRERPVLWDRHVLNSLALAPLVPQGASVLDLGSGAGLPGLPLAIVREDLEVELREPLSRRTRFLELAVQRAGGVASVRRARAEDGADPLVDVVVCRAVAPLVRLLPLALPLLRPGGLLLALKGRTADEELTSAAGVLTEQGAGRARVERCRGPGRGTAVVVRVEAGAARRRRPGGRTRRS